MSNSRQYQVAYDDRPGVPMAPPPPPPMGYTSHSTQVVAQHTAGTPAVYTTGEAPRFKTNDEWVAEANKAAEAAAESVLQAATIERLQALHSQIIFAVSQGGNVVKGSQQTLVDEYATLAGE